MLNLLPTEVKATHQQRSKLYLIIGLYIAVLLLLGLGAGGLGAYNLIVASDIKENQAVFDRLSQERTKSLPLIAEAVFVQDRLNAAGQYRQAVDYSQLLDALSSATPTDVRLTNLKAAAQADKKVGLTLTGQTNSRRSIILFKDKLGATGGFSSVEISSMSDGATQGYLFSLTAVYTQPTGRER